ncbi:MAG: hypothetical protein WCD42_00065 [Rhizomicrobium sp.]
MTAVEEIFMGVAIFACLFFSCVVAFSGFGGMGRNRAGRGS